MKDTLAEIQGKDGKNVEMIFLFFKPLFLSLPPRPFPSLSLPFAERSVASVGHLFIFKVNFPFRRKMSYLKKNPTQ